MIKKQECPNCGRDPWCFENQESDGIGDSEWGTNEGLQEIQCKCGALLLLHYKVKFDYIEILEPSQGVK